jgi:hypothetical protein
LINYALEAIAFSALFNEALADTRCYLATIQPTDMEGLQLYLYIQIYDLRQVNIKVNSMHQKHQVTMWTGQLPWGRQPFRSGSSSEMCCGEDLILSTTQTGRVSVGPSAFTGLPWRSSARAMTILSKGFCFWQPG